VNAESKRYEPGRRIGRGRSVRRGRRERKGEESRNRDMQGTIHGASPSFGRKNSSSSVTLNASLIQSQTKHLLIFCLLSYHQIIQRIIIKYIILFLVSKTTHFSVLSNIFLVFLFKVQILFHFFYYYIMTITIYIYIYIYIYILTFIIIIKTYI